jgi:hypothetical protein
MYPGINTDTLLQNQDQDGLVIIAPRVTALDLEFGHSNILSLAYDFRDCVNTNYFKGMIMISS